jgi:D-glycero-D-manno-heptose 1,7-bisphosphate phosphatase
MSRKAFFFDRDGTLIKDNNYICDFSEVEVFPFSVEALRIMEKKDFLLIGITNQSSIARGICKTKQVELIHIKLIEYFKKENVNIRKIYFCPYLNSGIIDKYKRDDDCRKPKTGMILNAESEFDIDLSKSYMVGDSVKDIIAGINAGCKTALVLTGNGKIAIQELKKLNIKPNLIENNILEIAKKI